MLDLASLLTAARRQGPQRRVIAIGRHRDPYSPRSSRWGWCVVVRRCQCAYEEMWGRSDRGAIPDEGQHCSDHTDTFSISPHFALPNELSTHPTTHSFMVSLVLYLPPLSFSSSLLRSVRLLHQLCRGHMSCVFYSRHFSSPLCYSSICSSTHSQCGPTPCTHLLSSHVTFRGSSRLPTLTHIIYDSSFG